MNIELVPAYGFPKEIESLFSEYTTMLVEKDPAFGGYLKLQNYDEEILHLETKYGKPDGHLYLACCDGKPAGCIGLRKLDDKNCEMKRLFVRPEFREHHIGRLLVERILADAKEIGYDHIMLDTLPVLDSAIRMYKAYGFYEIPSYNNSPMEGLVYLKYDLNVTVAP